MARRIAFCCKLRSEPSGGRGALMANVLVTGGAGYVGSVCCAELLRLGHSVTVVDDLSTGFRDGVPRGAAFIPMDIGSRPQMEKLVQSNNFDVVFHFAAKALVAESVANPGAYFQTNVEAGVVMLEALRTAGMKNFDNTSFHIRLEISSGI